MQNYFSFKGSIASNEAKTSVRQSLTKKHEKLLTGFLKAMV
jgi:hypothetical protein